jgi:hypothetical protein
VIWIKNTEGKRDAILTMSLLGFLVVLVKFALSGLTIGPFVFGELDAGVVGALLTPTLGAYVARRFTDRKHEYSSLAQPSNPEYRAYDRYEELLFDDREIS